MVRQKPITLFKVILTLLTASMLALFSVMAGNAYAYQRKFNMSYVYFGNTDSYLSLVDNTKNSLNEISPNYFDLNSDGTLKLTPKASHSFVEQMHERGIKVVPFLSNHWDRELGRRALYNKQMLAQQIADAVTNFNLDGINIDIENLTEADRDNYTELVRLIREKLPEDKTVAVAVAPNPYNRSTGWQGSYDYSALARYCDYLMLMAYDEHYKGSLEGPIASASFVERSIKYALQRAPAEKIVLGIPFYGRIWKSGSTYGGYGVSNARVDELIKNYRGKVTYDTESKSPKAVISIKSTDPKPYISGIMLSTGTYNIWYENSQSIKYKLELVQKYNLKGTGTWSLGQESASTWNYFGMWLNGVYFADVEGHWAQEAILASALKGWVKGVSVTKFVPEASLTRAQAAVILVRALGLSGEISEESFPDTVGHWAENEINLARQHNIVKGNDDGNFEPESPVSREQMAVMLDRVLKGLQLPEPGQNVYKDISPDSESWSYESIDRLTHNGIFNGYPDGCFYPKNSITRAQMAAIMSKIDRYLFDE